MNSLILRTAAPLIRFVRLKARNWLGPTGSAAAV